jgi:hypothetical protein
LKSPVKTRTVAATDLKSLTQQVERAVPKRGRLVSVVTQVVYEVSDGSSSHSVEDDAPVDAFFPGHDPVDPDDPVLR